MVETSCWTQPTVRPRKRETGPIHSLSRLAGEGLDGGEVVLDAADGEAEEAVDGPHPLAVALGEVVVDGDDVHALARERVEISRGGGDQGLAFAGAHLGDGAVVQDH